MPLIAPNKIPPLGSLVERKSWSNSYTNYLHQHLSPGRIFIQPQGLDYRQDQDFREKLGMDPKFRGAEENLLAEISGVDWNLTARNVEENSDQIALFKDILGRIKGFWKARQNLAQSVLWGMSTLYIQWKPQRVKLQGDTRARLWVLPHRLVDMGPHRLRRDVTRVKGSNTRVYRWWVFNVAERVWKPLQNPNNFIWSVYRDEEWTLGYGYGLAQSLYYAYRLKILLTELVAGAAERYVESWVVLKLKNMKKTDNIFEDTDALDEVISSMEKMRAHGILAVTGEGNDVHTLQAGNSSWQMMMDMIEKIDRDIVICLNAANLPTDIPGGGSYAATQGQMETMNKRLAFQRETCVAEPITDWLLPAISYYNHANFQELGMADLPSPIFNVSGGQTLDPERALPKFQWASQAGYKVSDKDIREQLGLSVISETDPPAEFTPDTPGFSLEGLTQAAAHFNAAPAIDGELEKKDELEDTPRELSKALEEFQNSLLVEILGGQPDPQAKDKALEAIQKTLAYYDIRGQGDVEKKVEEDLLGPEILEPGEGDFTD